MFVTHLAVVPPGQAWGQILFLTKVRGHAIYFRGFGDGERYTPDEVRRSVERGDFLQLDTPFEIDTHQRLWLTPEGQVWLAVSLHPQEDRHRRLILPQGKYPIPGSTPTIRVVH